MPPSAGRRERFSPGRVRLPKEILRLLGKRPDAHLAALAGVHFTTITKERRRREIRPFRAQRAAVVWTPAMVSLLGTASDAAVARELGLPTQIVFFKRRKLGIPAFHLRPQKEDPFWSSARLAALGTAEDGVLAKRWRIHRARVAYQRVVRRIPPYTPRPARMRWTEDLLRKVGVLPDQRLAKELGIGEETVARQRRKLGRPPVRPGPKKVVVNRALRATLALPLPEAVRRTRVGRSTLSRLRSELGVPVPTRPSAWTKKALARLGRVPDAELAAELRLSVETVRLKRNQQGIRFRVTRPWTPAEDAVVRRLAAPAAAKKLGRTRKAVGHRRVRLGLAQPQPTSWTKENIALLGKVSDAEIARRLGITASAVRAARLVRGIPCAPKRGRTRKR